MHDSQLVESFRFGDVARLWARERLEHEVVVSHELVTGILAQGLRFQSADPRWVQSSEAFRGFPYVGYVSLPGQKPIMLRASALEHLLFVARTKADPSLESLAEEFVVKANFRQWLVRTGKSLPQFWFAEEERPVDAQQTVPVRRPSPPLRGGSGRA